MNVIDLSLHRRKREIQQLEQKISTLVLQPHSVQQIKNNFKEWLLKTGSS